MKLPKHVTAGALLSPLLDPLTDNLRLAPLERSKPSDQSWVALGLEG